MTDEQPYIHPKLQELYRETTKAELAAAKELLDYNKLNLEQQDRAIEKYSSQAPIVKVDNYENVRDKIKELSTAHQITITRITHWKSEINRLTDELLKDINQE